MLLNDFTNYKLLLFLIKNQIGLEKRMKCFFITYLIYT